MRGHPQRVPTFMSEFPDKEILFLELLFELLSSLCVV